MNKAVVVTLIGDDQPGLVNRVAAAARGAGANWLESRMAHLAGRFAGIVHLQIPEDRAPALEDALRGLAQGGLSIAFDYGSETKASQTPAAVSLELTGHDQPGIVEQITQVLARHQVSIEQLETRCEPASMSGAPMFWAQAELTVPQHLELTTLQADLEAIAHALMVDLELKST